MKILAIHPGPLMYTKIYLRLEPLGLELVVQAVRQAGHEVRILDLQTETPKDYFKVIDSWKPDVVVDDSTEEFVEGMRPTGTDVSM